MSKDPSRDHHQVAAVVISRPQAWLQGESTWPAAWAETIRSSWSVKILLGGAGDRIHLRDLSDLTRQPSGPSVPDGDAASEEASDE